MKYMFTKPAFKTYAVLVALVAVFLAPAFGYISGSVKSNRQKASPMPPAPGVVVSTRHPIPDWRVVDDGASAMETRVEVDAEGNDIGRMVPSQSLTLPLTASVYLPAIFAYNAIPVYTHTVVHAYPHDPDAFTQGLIFETGVLYEGTGLWGRSSLRKVDLETGSVLQIYELPDQYFGEGVTVYGDRIVQLTWRSHVGFVYDKDSFTLLQTFDYPTEGWGITHDGERLIMSDGTSTLYFLDPETFDTIDQVEVYDNDGPVVRLNELEYVQGEVYANVWQTDRIARIDPHTGRVVGWINLEGLLSQEDLSQPVDVLNGIAYDVGSDRLFVTGKLWPKLFEIELILQGTLRVPGGGTDETHVENRRCPDGRQPEPDR
jgi:glutamine cyclotransferase